jgi:hypothetical protein
MAKSKKRQVRDTLGDISPYELEGSLQDLRARVDQWIEDHGADARLDWDAYFHHAYDHDPSPRYNIVRDREETDDEYERRTIKEKIDKQMTEERERAEFERLQKKFAGKK